MATSGNMQVLLAEAEVQRLSAGSNVVGNFAELSQVSGGSNTLGELNSSLGPLMGGSNTLGGLGSVLGPPGGSNTLGARNAPLGPSTGGSNVLQDEAEAMAGNIQGRPSSGLPATAPGGLGVSVDGSPVSEREEVNLVASLGATPEVSDDAGNDRADVSFEVNAEIELDRRTIDLVGAGSVVLFSPVAPLVGVEITRVTVRTLTVTTPGTAPQISLQTLVAGDILSATVVTPTVADRVQSILANVESAFALTGGSVTLVKDVLSTAAVYSVEVALYGRARK